MKISVKAIIVRNKRILLLKPKNQRGSIRGWDGSGGHVEKAESLLSALRREVLEETCLRVRKAVPFKIITLPNNKTDYLIFLCSVSRGKVRLSREHIKFKWVTVADLSKITNMDLAGELGEISKFIDVTLDKNVKRAGKK